MAQMPVEIIEVGNVFHESVQRAISLANAIQSEFVFSNLPAGPLDILAFKKVKTEDFVDRMEDLRKNIGGYHPFMIAFVDAELETKHGIRNVFSGNDPRKGLAVTTVSNVPDLIIPTERMNSYFLYYLARCTISFVVQDHENHEDTRSCVFDFKRNKRDLLQSMKARAFCDGCRQALTQSGTLSPNQFSALAAMFDMSGKLLETAAESSTVERRPRAFIGSSSEGLAIAERIKSLLKEQLLIDIWNEGTVFGLGDSTLEALERAVLTYEFGIFVFTPDDKIHIRGEVKPVARDNVIFESGLFIGKLTRRRTFVVHPSDMAIALPTDFSGITTARYDPNNENLESALSPACNQILDAIARSASKMKTV
jgi:predicted nucleotide-binding protein